MEFYYWLRDYYSYQACDLMYTILQQRERRTGIEIEFDKIDILNEFEEFKSIKEAEEAYQLEKEERLQDRTIVYRLNRSVLVSIPF